jgi:hypothetical protein
MQINDNKKGSNNSNKAPNIEEERDLELENIVGNLMIAQYPVDKLRSRLSERIGGYGSASNKRPLFMYSSTMTNGTKLQQK